MKQNPESVREQISALADGRLQGDAFKQAMDRLAVDDESQSTWQAYHLIGDVLRTGRPSACSDSSAFLARFQQRLAEEAPVVSVAAAAVLATPVAVPVSVQRQVEAANEPIFRWKLVAGAASLVAAAAIGWNWVGVGPGAAPAGAQMAQQQQSAPSVQVAKAAEGSVLTAVQQGGATFGGPMGPTRVIVGSGSGNPQVMLRDPRLDQLLEAHRQAAGGAQMPSGFLRNATFESSAR
ncbi:sigma-E factor negative regulatory protein [Variovorax boronicumulans]|uniref:sigma-E factor negative regulatory protein n=1 Tax=Variovorax boronicumulans TaxID=436515 RepID=UPI001C59BC43